MKVQVMGEEIIEGKVYVNDGKLWLQSQYYYSMDINGTYALKNGTKMDALYTAVLTKGYLVDKDR